MISEKAYFYKIKQEIVGKLLKNYPSSSKKVEDWKGKDIANFQADLEETVNGRISEKWIYTHLKNEGEKLPRKDMLDLLASYVGAINWDNYIQQQETEATEARPIFKKKIIVVVVAVIVIALGIFLFFDTQKECKICFVDAERQALVLNSPIKLYLLKNNESPLLMNVDGNACAEFTTKEEEIKFVVKSPYYKSDTIIRNLERTGSKFEEEIKLKTNDYALMIHIFSSSKIEDWKKRRQQLDGMITDNAQIYQIFEQDNIIMDLYNKWDFINKLTTPTRSLKNIQVIETQYHQGKIQVMRFKQIDNN